MIGHHIIWDIFDCDEDVLKYVNPIKYFLNEIVNEIQLGKVSESYKQFEPHGVTGFILLEESHISIHTWPEHHFAAIDIFSCKPFDKEIISEILVQFFKTANITSRIVSRGLKEKKT